MVVRWKKIFVVFCCVVFTLLCGCGREPESSPTPAGEPTGTAPAAEAAGICISDGAHIYSEPAEESALLGALRLNEEIPVIKKNEPLGWHCVWFHEQTGYIRASDLQIQGDATPSPSITPTAGVQPSETQSSPTVTASKRIALTFDDGPSQSTLRILEVLKQYGGKATFCVVGSRLNSRTDILKKIAEEGHEIASHTWSHGDLNKLSEEKVLEELQSVNRLVFEATGKRVAFLRPPYGNANETVKQAAAQENMAIVRWCIDTLDWKTKDPEATYKAIVEGAKDGDIILCHDLYSSTADAMELVIPKLVEDGFELVTVSELIGSLPNGIEVGKIYRSGRA
ncbi:MAG: polysaccharide deacetylase family protein [Clostridiales bacterium]|nr:polysaccharide deacetylase family protein [Clostridiales bacterium]